jgi:phospholipid/cholesterol/gamma-HCH transport system substrate-binding protein
VNTKGILAPIIAIVLLIPVVLIFKHAVFETPNGTYVVKAELTDASGLVPNSNVKIGGVDAGIITHLELSKDDTALVTMLLDPGSGNIGEGATAAARPVNLLGEKYMDLEVGDLSKPLPSGTSIPLARTSTPVEIDDALNILAPDVRARLRILVNEAGIMLAGRGSDFNGLLEELPPAIDQIADLTNEARSETDKMKMLIDQGDRVVASISGNRGDLGNLVDSAADALRVTASRREELGNTFREAPTALTQLQTTLGKLTTTSNQLKPAAADLRRTADPLHDTLEQLPDFADAAQNTLRTASAISPDLVRLGREGTPVVERLRPTLNRLRHFVDIADPIIDQMDGNGSQGSGSFAKLMGVMNNWAGAIGTSDGLSHLFGIRAYVSKNTFSHALERYLSPGDVSLDHGAKTASAKPANKKPSTASKSVNAYDGPDKSFDTADGDAVKAVGDKVKDVVDKTKGLVDDTVKKVNDLKDKLLGEVKDRLGKTVDDVKGLAKLGTDKLKELLDAPQARLKGAVDKLLGGGQSSGSSSNQHNDALRLLDYLFAP